jgi:hypothetical protein
MDPHPTIILQAEGVKIYIGAHLSQNSKPTTTDRQRHYLSFIDNATLTVTNLISPTTNEEASFLLSTSRLPTDDRQCRSINSM